MLLMRMTWYWEACSLWSPSLSFLPPTRWAQVEDPYLAEHLAHWGINMMKMTKTAKTMDEMEYEGNMK